jgi:hypothetical protein
MLSHAFAPITSLTKLRRYITFHNFAPAIPSIAELCLRVTVPFNVLPKLSDPCLPLPVKAYHCIAEAERSELAPAITYQHTAD